ncbi:MAG TPA: hypothetical protein VFM88_23015 [Vicinamibacteria bacterium]|nr:hypothetical protein [Vicinamibacteria bacterium]
MRSPTQPRPAGLYWSAAFFVAAGLMEVALPLLTDPGSRSFVRLWEATGKATLDFLVALGLWKRVALVRSVAMVYCLGAVAAYTAALAFAWSGAPFRYPQALVIASLFEVPSCALLYPWLRSPAAGAVFTRPLLGS